MNVFEPILKKAQLRQIGRVLFLAALLWTWPAEAGKFRTFCELYLEVAPKRLEPSREQALRAEIQTSWDALDKFWRAEFKKRGWLYESPKLNLFGNWTSAPGGGFDYREGPVYIRYKQTVYLSLHTWDFHKVLYGVDGPAARAFVVAHEFAHHVQHLRDILRDADESGPFFSITRMVELQANALAVYWLKRDTPHDLSEALAFVLSGSDRMFYVTDDRHAGSVRQRRIWFERGANAASLGDLNTFTDEFLRTDVPADRHDRLNKIKLF